MDELEAKVIAGFRGFFSKKSVPQCIYLGVYAVHGMEMLLFEKGVVDLRGFLGDQEIFESNILAAADYGGGRTADLEPYEPDKIMQWANRGEKLGRYLMETAMAKGLGIDMKNASAKVFAERFGSIFEVYMTYSRRIAEVIKEKNEAMLANIKKHVPESASLFEFSPN